MSLFEFIPAPPPPTCTASVSESFDELLHDEFWLASLLEEDEKEEVEDEVVAFGRTLF